MVSGYIRGCELMIKINIKIPKDIYNIILLFLHASLDKFKFDPKHSAKEIKFDKNYTKITHLNQVSRVAASNHIISSKLCNEYYFEIETGTKLNFSHVIAMGFVYHPIKSSLCGQSFNRSLTAIGKNGHIANIHLSIYSFGANKSKKDHFDFTDGAGHSMGDKFKMKINFIDKTIVVFPCEGSENGSG